MSKIHFDKLAASELKDTPRRRAIISFFEKSTGAKDPETVWEHLKTKFRRCGLPGVYRNLEQMVNAGILVRVQREGRKRYYGLCPGCGHMHHHHIVCVKCGKIGEMPECTLFKGRTLGGFKIVDHFIQLSGICPECGK